MEYIRFFATVDNEDVALVGGKNASLGEMYQHLAHLGVSVPHGFSTTRDAYTLLLSQNNLSGRIESIIGELDVEDVTRLLTGRAIGEKIGIGVVKVIRDLSEASRFEAGQVLVTDITDPDWEPLMKKASAVVTSKGGRTCHAAIVAREIGVAAIVGTSKAMELLQDGMEVTVCCAEGEEGHVYEGRVDFKLESIDLKNLEEPKTKLLMNVGNPEKALALALIPNQGVGLARMEFIINNHIKAHPMALYDMYQGRSVKDSRRLNS